MSADNATWEYCDPRRVTFDPPEALDDASAEWPRVPGLPAADCADRHVLAMLL